jgi:hypothetical protein
MYKAPHNVIIQKLDLQNRYQVLEGYLDLCLKEARKGTEFA